MKLNWIQRQNPTARSVALGTFDGVHLGHQRLLQEAIARKTLGGTSCVCTFDIPPEQYFQGRLRLLSSFQTRVELFLAFGIDEVAWLPFGTEFTSMEAQDFVTKFLVNELRANEVICGYNYRFGSKRGGDAAFLQEQGKLYGFSVTVVPPVTAKDGQTISSTAIRKLLAQGRLAAAARYLGYYPSYRGEITRADRGDRSPLTARFDPALVLPGEGVYLTRCLGPKHEGAFALAAVRGACDIELFMLDSRGQGFGHLLDVQFVHRLGDVGSAPPGESERMAARQLLPGFHLQDGKVVLK
jgi:riboflavin kinase/FMN adenylyltransferase